MNKLEEAFSNRYNRKVSVVAEGKENTVNVDIKYRDAQFKIVEKMKEGLTDYVDVTHNGKTNRFRRYIDAEIFIADKIGEM